MYGNCVSCGFPISLHKTGTAVNCPNCSVANAPISAPISDLTIPTGVIWFGLGILTAIVFQKFDVAGFVKRKL